MWDRRIRRRAFLATAGMAGAALALPWRQADAATSTRRSKAAQSPAVVALATPDSLFNSMFTAYGNNTDPNVTRWTGADSAYSIRLPDGRAVWIFSDTFLGYVVWETTRQAYSRPLSTPFVHNTYVIQDANSMTLSATLYGGTASAPTSLVNPVADDGTWYWMGNATIEAQGHVLRQFVTHWKKTGSGIFDFAQVGTDIATFSLPDLTLQSIDPTPKGNGYYVITSTGYGVSYAAAIREDPTYTYLYGVEDGGLYKWLHIARAPAGHVFVPWEFWNGSAWSSDPQQSARLLSSGGSALDNLANEIGVTDSASGGYNLIDQDFDFGNDILLYTAAAASGPWTNQGTVYYCPENAYYEALGYGSNVYPYNAKSHEEFVSGGQMLLSYNVNSFNDADVYSDASIYRPRFLRLAMS